MMRRSFVTLLLLIGTFAALATSVAHAHKASDSYLALQVDGEKITGQWDIALRDLDIVLDLDRNADAVIDWGEVRTRHAEIAAYALSHLALKASWPTGAACTLSVTDHLIDNHTDGAYAVMKLAGSCPSAAPTLSVNYSLLFDVDAQHRGLLKLSSSGAGKDDKPFVVSAVFPAENATQTAPARRAGSRQRHMDSSGRFAHRVLERVQDRHRVHPGAFDYAVVGCVGRGAAAFSLC